MTLYKYYFLLQLQINISESLHYHQDVDNILSYGELL